ncbi:MAG: hypothetical protein ABW196_06310 [Solirubrobacterales bacterium]
MVKGWAAVSLFYSPDGQGGFTKVAADKTTYASTNFQSKATANAVCRPGWYAAVGAYFAGLPPGTIPPYKSAIQKVKPIYVGC